jgi:peptidoglycan biosynthesis protein MviN/MurJ (putative lipid II flippase)
VAGLALGLPAYGAFRLFAAAWYALDDSRTPALAAVASAVAGVVLMIVLTPVTDGAARIFILGAGHSVAFGLGAIALAVGLRARRGVSFWPTSLPGIAVLATACGGIAWVLMDAWAPDGRLVTAVALLVIGAVAGGLYYLALRGLHLLPGPLVRTAVAP